MGGGEKKFIKFFVFPPPPPPLLFLIWEGGGRGKLLGWDGNGLLVTEGRLFSGFLSRNINGMNEKGKS